MLHPKRRPNCHKHTAGFSQSIRNFVSFVCCTGAWSRGKLPSFVLLRSALHTSGFSFRFAHIGLLDIFVVQIPRDAFIHQTMGQLCSILSCCKVVLEFKNLKFKPIYFVVLVLPDISPFQFSAKRFLAQMAVELELSTLCSAKQIPHKWH